MGQTSRGAAAAAYDVRVLSFGANRARALVALQQLFGLDAEHAQRMLSAVPLVVRRAAPANEAQEYVDALRGIGARVVLERQLAAVAPGPPPPPTARGRLSPPPPPPPRPAFGAQLVANDGYHDLPRPRRRPPSADLEFDVLSAPQSELEPLPGLGGELSLAEPEPELGRRGARGEIELDIGHVGDALDIDPAAVVDRAPAPYSMPQEPVVHEPAAADGPLRGEERSPAARTGGHTRAGPMSRAAVVNRPVRSSVESGSRYVPLLLILAAVAIGVMGVWLDNTILYGNATPLSVVAHGLGIAALGLGLRGLVR